MQMYIDVKTNEKAGHLIPPTNNDCIVYMKCIVYIVLYTQMCVFKNVYIFHNETF